jgi:hypothetical protein
MSLIATFRRIIFSHSSVGDEKTATSAVHNGSAGAEISNESSRNMRAQQSRSYWTTQMRLSDSINHFTTMMDLELPEDAIEEEEEEYADRGSAWDRPVRILGHNLTSPNRGFSNDHSNPHNML